MKNKHLIIYYLKDFRVIVGIIILLTAFFGSSEGRVYRSAWDSSIRYQSPIDHDMKIMMFCLAFCAIFFGIMGKRKKLKELSNTQNQEEENKNQSESKE